MYCNFKTLFYLGGVFTIKVHVNNNSICKGVSPCKTRFYAMEVCSTIRIPFYSVPMLLPVGMSMTIRVSVVAPTMEVLANNWREYKDEC